MKYITNLFHSVHGCSIISLHACASILWHQLQQISLVLSATKWLQNIECILFFDSTNFLYRWCQWYQWHQGTHSTLSPKLWLSGFVFANSSFMFPTSVSAQLVCVAFGPSRYYFSVFLRLFSHTSPLGIAVQSWAFLNAGIFPLSEAYNFDVRTNSRYTHSAESIEQVQEQLWVTGRKRWWPFLLMLHGWSCIKRGEDASDIRIYFVFSSKIFKTWINLENSFIHRLPLYTIFKLMFNPLLFLLF